MAAMAVLRCGVGSALTLNLCVILRYLRHLSLLSLLSLSPGPNRRVQPAASKSGAPRMARSLRLILGDTFEYLPTMPTNSIDCVVTSPPKWTAQRMLTYAQGLKAHAEIDRRSRNCENNRIMLHPGNAQDNPNRDGFCFEDWNKNGAIGSNVWQIGRNLVRGLAHPCPFPIRLAWNCIRRTCPHSGVVFDPFMGSGTTLVAARMLDRAAIGIEFVREHWESAKKRVGEAHRIV
jgi:DNA modification methylase